MRDGEFPPNKTPDIASEHARFFITNLDTLHQRRDSDNADRHIQCVTSNELLNQNVFDRVSLDAYFQDDELILDATMLLNKDQLAVDWKETLKQSLIEEEMDFNPENELIPRHDSQAMYLSLPDGRYARFDIGSDHENGIVTLNIIPRTVAKTDPDDALADDYAPYIAHEYLVLLNLITTHAIDRFGTGTLELNLDMAGAQVRVGSEPSTASSVGAVATGTALATIPKEGLDASPIEQTTRTTGFNLLGGLHYPKQRLQEIADVFNNPEAGRLYGFGPTHFLLHGPPGTGKTSLIAALAAEMNAELVTIPSTAVIDKYVGESPKYLRECFETAFAKQSNQVLFFDEFDGIGAENLLRSSAAYGEVQRTLQELLTGALPSHPEIVVAAATNVDIDDIAPALVRSGRLEPISVAPPNAEERLEVWATLIWESERAITGTDEWSNIDINDIRSINTPPFTLYDSTFDIKKLSELSDGFTGADITKVLETARRAAYRRHTHGEPFSTVTQHDLEQAITHLYRR